MLAEKTGWSEEFILWQLPLHRALAYQHCAMWQSGAWTVEPQPSPTVQIHAIASLNIDDEE
jgi:hypothetical protein